MQHYLAMFASVTTKFKDGTVGIVTCLEVVSFPLEIAAVKVLQLPKHENKLLVRSDKS
jgi:hypothetical protein